MGSTTAFYQVSPHEAIAAMQLMVRSMAEQDAAEKTAYERGWRECGEVMAKYAEEIWRSGYEASEREMEAAWKTVARAVRANGSPNVRTFGEKRQAELESLRPRPNDFMGMDAVAVVA